MPSTLNDRVAGISTSVAVKAPVRVATTANITLSGLQSIDGVTVVADDRVLVKNQSTTTENGIYKASTSSWERSEDFDGSSDAVKGTRVWIVEGSAQAGQEWNLTTANQVVFGTSAIVFAQSPLQDAVDAAEAAQAAAEAAAGSVNLPTISGGDAGKGLKVNAGETAFDLTTGAFGTAAFLNVGTGASQIVQRDGSGDYPAGSGAAITDVVAALPPTHIDGLVPSHDTDADHDIQISTGSCRDSTNAYNLTLSAIITKQIDAGWAAGDDAGGLFSGSVANSTTYHIFIIRKDSDGSIDAGFDTSITAANIPVGYTAYRRVGSLHTDGSANFTQVITFEREGGGVEYRLLAGTVETFDDAATGVDANTQAIGIPIGRAFLADMQFIASFKSGTANVLITALSQTATAPSDNVRTCVVNTNSTLANFPMWVLTDTSAQFRYEADVDCALAGYCRGWLDTRK